MKKVLSRATMLVRIVMTLLLMLSVVGYNNSVVYGETLNEVNLTIVPPTVGEKSDEVTPDVTISDEIGVTVESKEFVDETGAEYQESITFEEEKELGIQVVLKADSDNSFDENTKVIPSVGNLLNNPTFEDNSLTFTVITTPQKQENKEKSDKETDEIVPSDHDALPLGIPNDTSSNGQCPEGHDWNMDSITYEWTEKGEDLNKYYEVEARATCVDKTEGTYENVTTKTAKESYTKEPSTTEEGEITFVAEFENDPFTPQNKVLIAPAIPSKVKWNFDIAANYGSWDQYYDDYAFRNQIQIFEENQEETDWYEPSDGTGRETNKNFSKFIDEEGKYHFRVRTFVYDPDNEYPDYYRFGKYSEWSDFVQFYKLTVNKIILDEQGQEIEGNKGYLSIVENGGYTAVCSDENTESKFLPATRTYGLSASDSEGYAFVKYEVNGVEKTDNEIEFTPSSNLVINAYFQEDNSESTITVKFGEKHADVAQNFKDALPSKYAATIKDDVVTYKYPKVGSSEGYVLIKMPDQFDGIVDDEESLYLFAKNPIDKYQSEGDIYREQSQMYNTPLGDTLELNAIWFKKATKGTFKVEAPVCGQVVKVIDESDPECDPMVQFCYSIYKQENGPVVTVTEDSHFVVAESAGSVPTALWMSEKGMSPSNWLDNETIDPNESYLARIGIGLKFGYYLPVNLNEIKITVNGNPVPAEDFDFYGSAIYSTIKATHKWKFANIIWDYDKTDNKTIASALYVCENDREMEYVPAEIDDSDPKKLVATVSAEDSLDGQEHTGEIPKVFNLYVQGVHVNGDNCDDILKNGTVKYNPETNTLTLNNATIEVARREYGVADKNEYGIRVNLGSRDDMAGGTAVNKGLTIELIGSNKIVDNKSESDTTNKYGIVVTSQPSVTYKGGGSLDITVNSEGSNQYRGIELHQSATIDGVDITINMLGTASETNGMRLYYNNLVSLINNADVNINVEQGYAFDSDTKTNKDLFVEKGSIFEAISKGIAAVHGNGSFQIKEEIMELGALVNSEASKEGAKVWDKESNLQNYKYLRIPEAAVLTIKWSSIDEDDLMDEIRVLATRGKTIAEACESVQLFEKEGYKAFGVFLDKSMFNYTNEMDMSEADLSGKTVDDDMTLYYPMIKEIKSVDLTLNPVKSGSHTATPKNGDEWDYAKQTNRPDITYSSNEYSLVDEVTIWVENFEDEPLTPYIGKFDEGTYKGVTIVIPNFGYAMADDVKYNIDGATFVKNDNLILYFTATVDSEYQNIKGNGNVWVKESNVSSEFVFKNDKDDSKTFSKFLGIKVDGMDVDKSKYDAVEGSVKIYLKPSYLETLSVGKHTLTAIFEDGQAEAVFTIVPKSTPQSRTYVTPKTGVE